MRVLLVPDRPGWAYDILAESIVEHSRYEAVDVQYLVDLREDLEKADFNSYDVVFFFLWYDAMRYGPMIKGFRFEKTCVGIHSLASWENRGLTTEQASQICNQFGAAGYISEELGQLLNLRSGFFTPNGIEGSIFYPDKIVQNRPLRLMWVGNPSTPHHGENKGFHSIVKPVVESFSEEEVVLKTATPEHPVPRDAMGDFYRANDVLLCTSKHEGGPLPIIEALACGRPVISTPVGVVHEVVQHGVNGLLIERNQASLKGAIQSLLDDSKLLQRLGEGTSKGLVERTVERTVPMYDEMFAFVHRHGGNGA
jgi:hypothetical protein